jgi:hypothetical protein
VDDGLHSADLGATCFGQYMNARTIAAIALSFVAFNTQIAIAAEGPLAHFAGQWTGAGKIVVKDGASERIRCRSTNTTTSKGLNLNLRCASDSYKFELASDISYEGGNISGSWNETSRGVVGSLSGKATASNITATAEAIGFSAGLGIRANGNSLAVSIRSPGSEISEVSITMAKGR